MTTAKELIAEALSQIPEDPPPDWDAVVAAAGPARIDHVEPDGASIHTIDCLFDGEAAIVLTDDRVLHATVFGRFDTRRVEIDRIVLEA